jgi:hypothetical protein
MTEQTVIIDAGTLDFSEEDLTATGLLVPFGVKCRSNLGEFAVDSGVFTIPADLTGAGLNIEHKREDVRGALTKAWEQPEGVMGTFKFAATDEGRQAFADAKSGKRKHLSAEVAGVRIRDGRAIAGRIFGAALVERPAFAGATLLAAEDTTEAEDIEALVKRVVAETIADLNNQTPDATPAEDNQEGRSTVTITETEPGQTPATPAAVPATLLASGVVPTSSAAAPAAEDVDLGTLFASLAAVKSGVGNTADAETLLAALSDIKYNTTGGLTTSASGVLQPAWVGKLWQGKRYSRKYIDLVTHLFGGIQLGGRKGFTITAGGELVAEWSGNKTELPSGGATTGTKASSLKKYAWAADIAREWYDLEGGADVIEAFLQLVVDSYARVTDQRALTDIIAAASTTTVANDRLVAPGTYDAAYPEAMGMLIDAIEAVTDADDEPSFAVVNPAAWRQLLFTPKDLVPEYVSFSVRAGTGEGSADGKVIVKKAPDSYFAGLNTAEPAIAAGAKGAMEFRELGTTPIQLDALDLAKGGIDKAVIGYLETFVVRPESLVLIGTATV